MAKIRGIKPDLWTDEDFVELSPFARLLWLGMWNYACDNGHLADKSKQIKMRVLPTDDVNCAELLREIEAQGLISRADGWITVPNLTAHQRPDRRYFTTCKKEGCKAPPETVSQRAARRAPAVHTTGTPRVHAVGTPSAHVDGDGDGDGEEGKTPSSAAPATPRATPITHGFDQFWEQYPRKVGKQAARKAYATATRTATPARLLLAAKRYASDPNLPAKEFVPHPSTWLNEGRWDDEPLPVRGERPGGPSAPSTSAWDKPAVRSAR